MSERPERRQVPRDPAIPAGVLPCPIAGCQDGMFEDGGYCYNPAHNRGDPRAVSAPDRGEALKSSTRLLPPDEPQTEARWIAVFVTILERANIGGNAEARQRIAGRWYRSAASIALAAAPPDSVRDTLEEP